MTVKFDQAPKMGLTQARKDLRWENIEEKELRKNKQSLQVKTNGSKASIYLNNNLILSAIASKMSLRIVP